MPLYVFRDPLTGTTSEEILPVEKRNEPIYRDGRKLERVSAPERISVPVGHPSPLDAQRSALQGYRKLEEKQKLRKPAGFDASAVKRAWA